MDTLGLLHDSSRKVFAQSYLSFTWEPSKVRQDNMCLCLYYLSFDFSVYQFSTSGYRIREF